MEYYNRTFAHGMLAHAMPFMAIMCLFYGTCAEIEIRKNPEKWRFCGYAGARQDQENSCQAFLES